MTAINKKCIDVEKFVAPLEVGGDVGKVSLFLISSKNSRLKKMNLEGLTPAARSEKLKAWGKEHRFVLVIEKGDMVFAHAHAKYAETLQNLDILSLNDKKVKVVALTEEQAAQVSEIGVAFEKYVLDEEKVEEKEQQHFLHPQIPIRRKQANVEAILPKSVGQTCFSISQMVKVKLGNLVSQLIKRFQEAREELKKQEKEDLKREVLKQEVIQFGVKKGEIQAKELKKRIVSHDQ